MRTNTTFDNLNNIFDYIYKDYTIDDEEEYCVYSVIYNNIYIQIVSDSDITQFNITFKYIESQIDINDLNLIKKTLFLAFDNI